MANSGTSSGQLDLWSDVPLIEVSGGQESYYARQDDLWSDIPPSRGILLPKMVRCQVRVPFV